MTKINEISTKILRYLRYYPLDLIKIIKIIIVWNFKKVTDKKLDNRDYIACIYEILIESLPSDEETNFYLQQIEDKHLSKLSLLTSFLMIPASLEKKLYQTTGIESHHLARLKLIQQLPQANIILDMGGASENPQGSLLEMGYSYQPKTINIIDLPLEKRYFKPNQNTLPDRLITDTGIEVIYYYQSMVNLSNFDSESIDLVWSGQSIEHITELETDQVLSEIYRILKPQGYFCLDTPNRKLTKLQVKNDFVHPEHKIEYEPEYLADKIRNYGFNIIESKAVSPLPFSLKHKRFSRLELINSVGISQDVNCGYSFYLKCQKCEKNYAKNN